MNIKKTVKALLIINGLQFVAAFLLWLVMMRPAFMQKL